MINKGQWVSCGNHYVCSECDEWAITTTNEGGDEVDVLSNFCPNCGADMREEKQMTEVKGKTSIPISWIRDYANHIDKAFEKWTIYQKGSQEKERRDMLHAQGTLLLLIDDWLDEVESSEKGEKEKALARLKAMRKCLDCNIDAKGGNCDECENNYKAGTMGEILETYDFIIKTLEGAE